MNWETVATSMLTSGGILFAAYKIWFQRRLEDHKFALQNNGKLFEIEIKILEEFGRLVQNVIDTDLGIKAVTSEDQILIMKSSESRIIFKQFLNQNSHALSKNKIIKIISILNSLSELEEKSKIFSSPNSSYCNGKYFSYNNIPESLLIQSNNARSEIIKIYEEFKKEIYSRAGRKT